MSSLTTHSLLQIPERMAAKLNEEIDSPNKKNNDSSNREKLPTWKELVTGIFDKAQEYIHDDMLFFPHYTSHGIEHINAVLKYAYELIPEAVMDKLDGKSLFVLIAGIILHDMGMHLDAGGVKRILLGIWDLEYVDVEKKITWDSAWNNYLLEVRRYPDDKHYEQFGMKVKAEDPKLDESVISWNDRLLVGEFLRRYHHILALGIQKYGFPTSVMKDASFIQTENEQSALLDPWDLAGILALSHGVPIREAENYVRKHFGNIYTPANVPIYYLMAVLRIADYLDAGAHRVPNPCFDETAPAPPSLSIEEKTLNQQVNPFSFTWPDKKQDNQNNQDRLDIQAQPEGTIEFIRLEKRLRLVQSELDTSWDAIARYYGMNDWQLSIKHITSNILDPVSRGDFEKKFVIKEAKLKADPELLKLLVEPLYQSDPSCGVRELIQNAVDACTERKNQAEEHNEQYSGSVIVSLDTTNNTLTVTDNGVGMNEDVILNYYLAAGVSYRNSDEWLKKYAKGRDPSIVRNGHFGVGVLATFLLGDTVTVRTWPLEADKGFTFSYNLQPKPLDIKRTTKKDYNLNGKDDAPVGTTITVKLKDDARKKLIEDYEHDQTWLNWYRFETPSVRYFMNDKPCIIKNTMPAVPQKKDPSKGWFDLRTADENMDPDKAKQETAEKNKFDAVLWGYPHDGFFCNGIRIPWGMKDSYKYNDVTVIPPSVSVIDKNGALQMDIARRFLVKSPLWDAVEREAVMYTMAQLLTADWSSKEEAANRLKEGIPTIMHPKTGMTVPFICKKDAYTLMHMPFTWMNDEPSDQNNSNRKEGRDRILVVYPDENTEYPAMVNMLQELKYRKSVPTPPVMIYPEKLKLSDKQQDLEKIFGIGGHPPFESRYYRSDFLRVYVRSSLYHDEQYTSPDEKDNWALNSESCESTCEYFHKNEKVKTVRMERESLNTKICPAAAEVLYGLSAHSKERLHDGGEDDLWSFVVTYMRSNPWIPYNEEERIKKFSDAFEVLAPYIPSDWKERRKNDA